MSLAVEDRQSLFDLALQMSGSIEAAFELAMTNDLSVTDELPAAQELQEAGSAVNTPIQTYYAQNNITPATALTGIIESGINFMEIEFDFNIA